MSDLGTWTYNTMYRTIVEKQKLCVQTAQKYKSSCIHVSRMGPDVVDVVLCTWSNVAIPAILTGCEMIPFCETRISEIERIQSQVAKFALGVPGSCPNICAQTELGLKPFRQLLMECQLKYYFRALYLHEDRWVHQALLDHLSGAWSSPYTLHISNLCGSLQLFSAIPAPSLLKSLTRCITLIINVEYCNQLTRPYHTWPIYMTTPPRCEISDPTVHPST